MDVVITAKYNAQEWDTVREGIKLLHSNAVYTVKDTSTDPKLRAEARQTEARARVLLEKMN